MSRQLRVAIVAVVVWSAMLLGSTGSATALQVGEKAQLFELPATTGEKIKLGF